MDDKSLVINVNTRMGTLEKPVPAANPQPRMGTLEKPPSFNPFYSPFPSLTKKLPFRIKTPF